MLKKNYFVINIDKLSYSANPYNVKDLNKNKNYVFFKVDLNNKKKITKILKKHKHEGIFNLPLKRIAVTAATDSRFFGIYQNTPALVYGPAGERIHAFDEYVDLDSLKNITKVYARFIQNWCGLTEL